MLSKMGVVNQSPQLWGKSGKCVLPTRGFTERVLVSGPFSRIYGLPGQGIGDVFKNFAL